MNDLSITQEYTICALNKKGKLSSFDTEKQVCFIAAALLDMQLEQCILIKEKQVTVTGELPNNRSYLAPLFDFINRPSPVKIEKILDTYQLSFTDKYFNILFDSVGASLLTLNLVESAESKIAKNRRYIPSNEAICHVIDMIKAELLEDGEVTEDIAALVALLTKSQLLKTYFSDFERKLIKTKLHEISNSEASQTVKKMIDYVDNITMSVSIFTAFNMMQ